MVVRQHINNDNYNKHQQQPRLGTTSEGFNRFYNYSLLYLFL